MDDVDFLGCGLPTAQDACEDPEGDFHCVNRACISRDALCDLTDDCGDASDEVWEQCEGNSASTFEEDNGDFTIIEEEGKPIKWARATGRGVNRGTGPAFDHTHFGQHGHFMYLDSNLGDPTPDEYAILRGPDFSSDSDGCSLTFYYHLYAHSNEHVGTLKVFSM